MQSESDIILPRVVRALEEVSRWREAQAGAAQARLDEVDAERQRLEADIRDLQGQVETLAELEEQIQAEVAVLPIEETHRTRAAVEAGIDAEASVLIERDEVLAQAIKAREDRVAQLLAQPDMEQLVEEFEQFQELEPTLANLPVGYRKAMLAHHQTVRAQLQPVMDAAQAPLAQADLPTEAVTIIASLNPAQGRPEALAVLLPVSFETYQGWADRTEDLGALVAYRLMGAVGATLQAVGASDASVQFADYRGLLAIQVWLGDQEVQGDLKEVFGAQIDRMRDEALELHTVCLELYTAWLDPRVVAASDDDDDTDLGDEDSHVEPDAGALTGSAMLEG